MTDPQTIGDLLERVRAAEGPSQELDCQLYCAFSESPFDTMFDDDGSAFVMAVLGGFRARLEWSQIPQPTASIDAALYLTERVMGRDGAEVLAQRAFGSTRHLATLHSSFAFALLAALLTALLEGGRQDMSSRSSQGDGEAGR